MLDLVVVLFYMGFGYDIFEMMNLLCCYWLVIATLEWRKNISFYVKASVSCKQSMLHCISSICELRQTSPPPANDACLSSGLVLHRPVLPLQTQTDLGAPNSLFCVLRPSRDTGGRPEVGHYAAQEGTYVPKAPIGREPAAFSSQSCPVLSARRLQEKP